MIIFLILITFAIDNQRILLGENWGWLLLRLTFRLPSNSDGQIFQPVGYLNIDCLNQGNIIISIPSDWAVDVALVDFWVLAVLLGLVVELDFWTEDEKISGLKYM